MVAQLSRPLAISLRNNTHVPLITCSYRYHPLACRWSPLMCYLKGRQGQRYYARPEWSNWTGTHWCLRCYKRYLLVELVQSWYLRDAWWLTGKAWQASELMQAVRWIREAREDEIVMVCELYGLEVA